MNLQIVRSRSRQELLSEIGSCCPGFARGLAEKRRSERTSERTNEEKLTAHHVLVLAVSDPFYAPIDSKRDRYQVHCSARNRTFSCVDWFVKGKVHSIETELKELLARIRDLLGHRHKESSKPWETAAPPRRGRRILEIVGAASDRATTAITKRQRRRRRRRRHLELIRWSADRTFGLGTAALLVLQHVVAIEW